MRRGGEDGEEEGTGTRQMGVVGMLEVHECWIGELAWGVCRAVFLLLLFLAFGVLLFIVIPRLCVQYNLWSRCRRVFLKRKPTPRRRPPISSANRLFCELDGESGLGIV